jgi:hypothetical protein
MPSPHSWRTLSARRSEDDARNAKAKAQRMARLRAAILAEVHGDGGAGPGGRVVTAVSAPAPAQGEGPKPGA